MNALRLKSRAVTLTELMMTITIIGIISASVIYISKTQIVNSYVADGISRFDQIETAVRQFNSIYQCLPGDCSSSVIVSKNAYLMQNITGNTGYAVPLSGDANGFVTEESLYTASPSNGSSDRESVNAIQHLVATGLLTSVTNGNVADNTLTAYPTHASTCGSFGYGIPSAMYNATTAVLVTNSIYNLYNAYFIPNKGSTIFFMVKSVWSDVLPDFKGAPDITYNGHSAVLSVSANYMIPSSPIIDKKSLSIMSGMDIKADGDTPRSGLMQAVFQALPGSAGTANTCLDGICTSGGNLPMVFPDLINSATTGNPGGAGVGGLTGFNTNSPLFQSKTGVGGPNLSSSGTINQTWSAIESNYSTIFSKSVLINNGTQAQIQGCTPSSGGIAGSGSTVVSVRLVKPIWGLIVQ